MIRTLKRSWEKNWPEVHCALRGGLPGFLLARTPAPGLEGVPVFCYHVPVRDEFERDLEHLARNGYQTLSADALLEHLAGRAPVPANSVVLSFDDGSVEIHRVAYPLLRRYGFTAVAFVAPYFHDHASAAHAGQRVCTWDELAEMHDSGVLDVQSHTFEHRLTNKWPRPAPICGVLHGPSIAPENPTMSLAEDLARAKSAIEERLGKAVRHLGFPCYYGTDEAIAVGRSLGYQGFWWGVLPGIPDNRPGDGAAERIVRVSGEFVRRLPGLGRVSLGSVMANRYRGNLARWRGAVTGRTTTAPTDQHPS